MLRDEKNIYEAFCLYFFFKSEAVYAIFISFMMMKGIFLIKAFIYAKILWNIIYCCPLWKQIH